MLCGGAEPFAVQFFDQRRREKRRNHSQPLASFQCIHPGTNGAERLSAFRHQRADIESLKLRHLFLPSIQTRTRDRNECGRPKN